MAPLENELAWKLASSLADRIGGDRYELYFNEQSFSLEHGRLLVQAADEFSLERLRSQFADALRQTVDFVLGSDVQLVYCVEGESRSQQSLFPDLDLDSEGRGGASNGVSKNSSAANDSETEVSIATAALSLEPATAFSSSSSYSNSFRNNEFDSVVNRNSNVESHPAFERPVLVEGRSDQVGRLAEAVKRQTEDQARGQMNLFADDSLSSTETTLSAEPTSSKDQSLDASHTSTNSVNEPKLANDFSGRPASAQSRFSVSTLDASKSRPKSSAGRTQTYNEFKAKQEKPSLPGSRAAMTMATFQFGEENKLAKAAIEQIVQRPGLISPVVIHGPVGCGKSHLATGLGHQLRGTFRAFSVLHLSAEQFTSRFLEALNGSGLPNMRAKFREMDMLVLEDIQFFQNKKATIIELQHTIDALIKAGKQIILTADRHPNDLTFLGSEVQTRLVSGLVIPLSPADREARAQVCRQWCAKQGMSIDESLVQWMADHIVGDVRRLSGALFRVLAIQLSTGEMVTASKAMDLLSDYVTASHSICSLGQIQKVVCDVCGVDAKELNGSKRTRKISGARMLAMFLARKHTQAALSEIGDFFGGRRHSTVLAAEKRIKSWEQKNELIETGMQAVNTREIIRKVEAKLQAM